MPSSAYRGRMFTAAEVRRVLRRAAEIEDSARVPREGGASLSIEEVEQIAASAGIGEEAIRQALVGGDEPAPSPRPPWSLAGAPARLSIERTVRGSVSAVDHGKLARAMRAAVGELGSAQVVGDSLSWSATSSGGRNVYAVVEPEGDGRVVVRVDENLRGLRGGLFGGIMGGLGGGGMSLVVALIAAVAPGTIPVVMVLWMVACYFIARATYVSRFRARERELRPVVEQIAALVEGTGKRVATEDGSGARVADARLEEGPVEEIGDEGGGGDGRRGRAGDGVA